MTTTVYATFDGEVIRPDEPVELAPNTRIRVTIESEEPQVGEPYSFLKAARAANLEGPADWSERVDHYLYGREHDE